jgi:hypothetical protein
MKKNQTLLLILIVLGLSVNLYAQEHDEEIYEIQEKTVKKVNFQIRGGLNLSNLAASYRGETDYGTVKVGFNLSGIADIQLKDNLYLQTGLSLTSKGAVIDDVRVGGQTYKATMNAMYLQVPLYFVGKLDMKNNYKITFAAGPYFAYGVGGKTDFKQRGYTGSVSDDTFHEDGLWNRPDVGLGLEIGLELEKVVFVFGEDFGLAKAWKRSALTDDVYVRNQAVYLSVGFKF